MKKGETKAVADQAVPAAEEGLIAGSGAVNTVEDIVVADSTDVTALDKVEKAIIENSKEAVVEDDAVEETVVVEDDAIAEAAVVEDVVDSNEEVEGIQDPALENATEADFISSGDETAGPVEDMLDKKETPEDTVFFSLSVLDEYLASHKAEDKIIQESKGGNFVSIHSKEIYIPLSLLVRQ